MSEKKRLGFCVLSVFLFVAFWLLPGGTEAWAALTKESSKLVYASQDLYRLGRPRTFEAGALKEVAFPLGGIGTGTVSLGGRGNLRDWEIFNRPGKGVNLPFTFFSLYFEQKGQKPLVRVLEGALTPPFTGEDGIGRGSVPGLPRMERARFRGEYPFAWVEMEDSQIPLHITLESFNPFIPLKPEESGIPAFVVRFRVRNLSRVPAKVTIAGSILNPIGFDGEGTISGVGHDKFGQNLNEIRKGQPLSGILMSSRKVKPDTAAFGTMALATPWKNITYLSHWTRGSWWDDLQIFWDDFAADGKLADLEEQSPSPDKRTDIGTLGLMATIEPFGEVTLPFILAWNFPNFLDYFDIVREQRGKIFRNHYAERFGDAWAAAEHLFQNLPQLEKETRLFHEIFYTTTLPPYVLDAVSSQAAITRTTTCFWLEGGKFFGFEGCNDQGGCCPLNCGHVWNYEQSLAFLFPSLERFMREVDFLNNTKENGEMVFRTSLPLGSGVYWNFRPAADGSLGKIINLYRDWQISGDLEFLKKLWPKAKKVLEYAWTAWDADRDGLVEGEQHNTYDIEFYGPNSMIGAFYLGALLAGSKMAEAVGEPEAAKTYRDLLEKGQKNFNEKLWNGSYYVQKYDQVMEKKYQYGEGCLSDQMLGQWLAMAAGLGRFLPEDRLKTTLSSIFNYNFMTDFKNYSNVQRTYALNDERGLLLCTWPNGGRPPLPFVYSDEVWTGIEYQVASHLMYEGLIDEGLTIVKAVRDRYDGRRRNPWDEVECGHHYARAMSSWGILLALSGYAYSGQMASLEFAPKLYPDNFRTFWTTGGGWGGYSQKEEKGKAQKVELAVAAGELKLREFAFALTPTLLAKKVVALKGELGGKPFKPLFKQDGAKIIVSWAQPVAVKAGEKLSLALEF
jgi:non-lysosomal glucosylceramidase